MTLNDEQASLPSTTRTPGQPNPEHSRSLAAYTKAIFLNRKNEIYHLLARFSWRKLMPLPFHPRLYITALSISTYLSDAVTQALPLRESRPPLAILFTYVSLLPQQQDRVVAAARRDHQLALTCHVDAEIDGRVGRKRNIADIAGKHASDLVFKV